MNLYIIGAGGLGRGLAESLIEEKKRGVCCIDYETIFFVDDIKVHSNVNNIYVKYNTTEFNNIEEECLVLNAIGTPLERENIQKKLLKKANFIFPNYIDSDVRTYPSIIMGQGNIITRGVIFSSNIVIGDFNLLHFGCTIGHDVKIGNFNCVYPQCAISGYTIISHSNIFGANTVTLPKVSIRNKNVVGANSFINKNILSNRKLVGSPIREIGVLSDEN